MHTAAEGLATRVGFELPQQILRERLADFVLVSEDEIRDATLRMLERTRNLIEPAGAAPLAAALKLDLAGQKVGLIASGGNMTLDQLRDLLASSGVDSRACRPTEGRIPYAGGETWYRIVGDGEEPGKLPLVCLHGGPGALARLPRAARRSSPRPAAASSSTTRSAAAAPGSRRPPDFWTVELFVGEVQARPTHSGSTASTCSVSSGAGCWRWSTR